MNRPLEIINKGRKPLPILFLVAVLIITVSLACSLPFRIVWTGGAEKDQVGSEQAKTAVSYQGSTAAPQSGESTDQAELSLEETPTGTPSLTPSPTVSVTPTPEQVSARISKATNCREGPKDNYSLIHIFVKGNVVDLLGKDEEGTYWFIQDQDGGVIRCWLWKEYATPDGLVESLPVFTPPPSPFPTLKFNLVYSNTSGETSLNMNVLNTGNLPLESYTATFKDTVTSESVSVSANKFGGAARVSVGNNGVISSPIFSASTIGHLMKATVKACSQDGQTGKCATISINFESN